MVIIAVVGCFCLKKSFKGALSQKKKFTTQAQVVLHAFHWIEVQNPEWHVNKICQVSLQKKYETDWHRGNNQ
jgi:hypothetical protein